MVTEVGRQTIRGVPSWKLQIWVFGGIVNLQIFKPKRFLIICGYSTWDHKQWMRNWKLPIIISNSPDLWWHGQSTVFQPNKPTFQMCVEIRKCQCKIVSEVGSQIVCGMPVGRCKLWQLITQLSQLVIKSDLTRINFCDKLCQKWDNKQSGEVASWLA